MKNISKYLSLILPHLGVLLIVFALILGYFYNWRGKAVLLKTDKTNVYITTNNELKIVPFALTLAQFSADFYEIDKPKHFEAQILVEENNKTKTILLQVNHPIKMGFGQDLYLLSYDNNNLENPEWCTVELVYDPFQKIFFIGIVLLVLGLVFSTLFPLQFHYF